MKKSTAEVAWLCGCIHQSKNYFRELTRFFNNLNWVCAKNKPNVLGRVQTNIKQDEQINQQPENEDTYIHTGS